MIEQKEANYFIGLLIGTFAACLVCAGYFNSLKPIIYLVRFSWVIYIYILIKWWCMEK